MKLKTMSNIEKIKAEIERLYDDEAPKHDQQCDFGDGYFHGLATILNFIDSLSEESDKSLEEAAENIYKIPFGTRAEDFIAGAEWQEKQDLRWAGEIHKNGYDLCKEQMMKDAVEGEIQMRYSGSLCAKTIRAINEDKFKLGDKVRIIIVKED